MYYLLIILLFLLFLVFKCVWQPWRRQKWYVNNFQKQGYRVYEVPFQPFSFGLLKIWDFSQNTEDAMAKVKKEYPHHDVAILNMFDKIFIELVNPELQQEFFSGDNLQFYKKGAFTSSMVRETTGSGLLLS